MEELWRDIPFCKGRYQVSNFGNVRSLTSHGKGNLMSLIKDKGGYLRVGLYLDSHQRKPKSFTVHRLVAFTFIENKDGKPQINHIDGNKCNNNVSNLEWSTARENTDHAIKSGLRKPNNNLGRRGHLWWCSKRIAQFTKDGEFIREWECAEDVQRELGYDASSIRKCASGKRKSCKGYIWENI